MFEPEKRVEGPDFIWCAGRSGERDKLGIWKARLESRTEISVQQHWAIWTHRKDQLL